MAELRDLTREQLLRMPIAASPDLRPIEKETCLNLLGGKSVLMVMSRHPSGVRGFLKQPEFSPRVAYVERLHGRETLVGIDGTLPLACLHIGAPRKRGFLSYVFATRSRSGKGQASAPGGQTAGLLPRIPTGAEHHSAGASRGDTDTSDCVIGEQ